MTVQITDPPDYSVFPYDEGWTATATIDSNDAVDGVLMDYSTNPVNVYPSPGPSGSGPNASGLYTWQVPFTNLVGITIGDTLVIYCYDAEISGDGASCEELASADGSGALGGGLASTIVINAPRLAQKTLQGTVQLPAHTGGGVFLVLANHNGDMRKHTRRIQVYPLPALAVASPQNYKFDNVDDTQWTHIHIVAVTYRHRGSPPAVLQFKPPPPPLPAKQAMERVKQTAPDEKHPPAKRKLSPK